MAKNPYLCLGSLAWGECTNKILCTSPLTPPKKQGGFFYALWKTCGKLTPTEDAIWKSRTHSEWLTQSDCGILKHPPAHTTPHTPTSSHTAFLWEGLQIAVSQRVMRRSLPQPPQIALFFGLFFFSLSYPPHFHPPHFSFFFLPILKRESVGCVGGSLHKSLAQRGLDTPPHFFAVGRCRGVLGGVGGRLCVFGAVSLR